MNQVLLILHIVVSIVLTILILLQSSKGGLGRSFGSGDIYRSKRGAEKIVFIATVVASVLFLLTSVLTLVIR